MVKPPADFSDEIFTLKKRYSDQSLIEKCFGAIRSTRKTGKVAETILLSQLQTWERYPADQVEASIRVYLDKKYYEQGKNEKYLLGIIRNHKSLPGSEMYNWPHVREITPENEGELFAN